MAAYACSRNKKPDAEGSSVGLADSAEGEALPSRAAGDGPLCTRKLGEGDLVPPDAVGSQTSSKFVKQMARRWGERRAYASTVDVTRGGHAADTTEKFLRAGTAEVRAGCGAGGRRMRGVQHRSRPKAAAPLAARSLPLSGTANEATIQATITAGIYEKCWNSLRLWHVVHRTPALKQAHEGRHTYGQPSASQHPPPGQHRIQRVAARSCGHGSKRPPGSPQDGAKETDAAAGILGATAAPGWQSADSDVGFRHGVVTRRLHEQKLSCRQIGDVHAPVRDGTGSDVCRLREDAGAPSLRKAR